MIENKMPEVFIARALSLLIIRHVTANTVKSRRFRSWATSAFPAFHRMTDTVRDALFPKLAKPDLDMTETSKTSEANSGDTNMQNLITNGYLKSPGRQFERCDKGRPFAHLMLDHFAVHVTCLNPYWPAARVEQTEVVSTARLNRILIS